MDKLASYSSDTESEQFDKSSPNRSKTEHDCNTPKDGGNLAAEWESFEKLISGSGEDCHEKDVVHVPSGVPAPTTEPGNIKQQYLSTTETRPDKCKQSETSVNISPDSSGACLKRKASLSSDSSESNSDSESADSSGGSSDSSEESSESDEPHSKKARSSSTSSEKHKSSSSDEESDEETSDEDGSNESDASSEERYKQKSSGDEDTLTVTSKKEDHAKKASDDHVRKKDETSSSGSKWSLSKSRRSRSHDRHKSSRHDRKKRDRSRGRKHHRRHSRHRSHHSRSHDRHHSRSRTRAHRQKRSRSRERRKRSSRHHSRSRSRDRYVRSRRHSRDRHRRWRSPPNPKTVHRKPITYKEVLRQKLMEAQQQAAEGKLEFDPSGGQNLMSTNEKPSPLPLMSINPLMSLATGPPGGEKVTPQQALMQTMAAMHQKAQELTGVAVPKYYNPAAVNPLKFAEQVKKRKLLWSKKDSKADAEAAEAAHQAALDKAASTSDGQKSGSGSSSSQWKSTAFLEDKDGRMAAKFRKLMGIKDSESSGANDNDPATEETIKKQQELFNQLDREYQFARMTTHTHRGIGLGFTSQMYPDLK